jgi:1-hydroxycarotenoid 3,4-desaturase
LARCGLQLLEPPTQATCRATTPADFARRFPGTGGALYGRATHGAMATFQRPGARTRVPGLYLAGGSVHPSAGVPMAALSGRMAARSLLEDSTSTGR